uniref:I-protein n=1 Tax=Ilyobacter tartaricus TaxID=167644 RepID=Q8KRV5_ILYTA|nr:i-protein [Ilyobacter tartaricus]
MNQEIKKILKNSMITSIIVFIYGLVVRSPAVYLGMFGGCIISWLGFYSICLEAEAAVKIPSFQRTVTGYLKRYLIYGIYLGILIKFWGIAAFLGGALGLLNIKFNIFIMTGALVIEKIKCRLKKFK